MTAFFARAAAFGLAHWRAVALGLLIAFAGVQTARLSHAKADQFDRSACVTGAPCKPPKWKAETLALRAQVIPLQRDLKTCRANGDTLQAIIGRQNAAAATLQAVSDQKMAVANKAAADARAVAASAREASAALSARELLGATPCARADDAQRAFLETAR